MSRLVRVVALAVAITLMAAPVAVLAQQGLGFAAISIPLQVDETGTPTGTEGTPTETGTPSDTPSSTAAPTETPTETPTPTLETPSATPTPLDTPTDTPSPTDLEELQALIDQVNSFAASGDIDGNMVNSLMSQLRAAMASLERGNFNSARGQLGAFINHVEAQRGKKISEAAAADLIAQAQAILSGF